MEYSIIAGINGAGKSTIYHSGSVDISRMGVRINLDELIKKEFYNN